ncbi:N-acetylmuramoyl-L-alanine amidase, partial [Hydrogenibacillus schlegelii]|uniref:N-acetylmuramoyl-L-alanine amidase n=1 Tax=Hydrogenibacillus schlegelii TaxID=1484 RepID=UPI0034A076AA
AKTGLADLGARYGNYYVLRENPRPSALIEFGFISNAAEQSALVAETAERLLDFEG